MQTSIINSASSTLRVELLNLYVEIPNQVLSPHQSQIQFGYHEFGLCLAVYKIKWYVHLYELRIAEGH